MDYYGHGRPTLIATVLPPRKRLYATCGIHDDPDRLLVFARTCGDCPADIEAATAESVKLEWWYDGERNPHMEAARGRYWVILTPAL